jgi:hypothetical protein
MGSNNQCCQGLRNFTIGSEEFANYRAGYGSTRGGGQSQSVLGTVII